MIEPSLPFSGVTSASREASQSGATCAARTRGKQQQRYVDLLREYGPHTDHAAAEKLGLQLSSINSIRSAFMGDEALGIPARVEPAGHEIAICHGREKKRTRWKLR